MDIILSKKLGHNIVEIIMTDLWKQRFNPVVEEIKEIKHDFIGQCTHDIHITNRTVLTYQTPYQSSCILVSSSIYLNILPSYWKKIRYNEDIWKK